MKWIKEVRYLHALDMLKQKCGVLITKKVPEILINSNHNGYSDDVKLDAALWNVFGLCVDILKVWKNFHLWRMAGNKDCCALQDYSFVLLMQFTSSKVVLWVKYILCNK